MSKHIVQFERIKYPDGQISAKLPEPCFPKYLPSTEEHVKVCQRITSYEDLMFVRSIAEVLDHKGYKHRMLYIPCLFAQRSDRRFDDNQSFDLKVVCDIINSCHFEVVEVFDPHSDIPSVLINNFLLMKPIMREVISKVRNQKGLILVAPDTGAYKKVFEHAERFNLPLVAAVKHRDKTGNINLVFTGDVKGKDCLIIDDICDGGATFIKLAEELKKKECADIYLYVSHGYFSKGFSQLEKNIKHIFCTNSVRDIEDAYVTQIKVI